MMSREDIPDDHASQLRQLCGLPGTEPIPEKLVNKYWANKIVCDRIQAPIRNEFIRIAVECGFGKLTEREQFPDVVQQFRSRRIAAGHPVVVNWRETKVKGTLVGVSATNEVTVLIDGEERKVTRESVALQSAA